MGMREKLKIAKTSVKIFAKTKNRHENSGENGWWVDRGSNSGPRPRQGRALAN